MLRTILLAAGLGLAVPAIAQNAPSAENSGRYQISPDEDGFVRLDTESGALSHCGRQDGVWRCAPLAEGSDLSGEVAGLKARIGELTAEVTQLRERIATLEARPATEPKPEAEAPEAEEQGSEFDQALSFFDELMQRFLDMVRELKKADEPPRSI